MASLARFLQKAALPVFGGMALLALAGCSGVDASRADAGKPSLEILWPAPPETARVAFQNVISRPSDLGIRRSGIARFGQWLTGSDKGNERLVKPFGLALDENDNLCVTDTGANAVFFYDRLKRKAHRWEKIGKVRFASPVAIAKRGDTLFVADSYLQSLLAFDTSGRLRFNVTNRLERPSGLALVGNELFVSDAQQHAILVFDLQGRILREFGKRGTAQGELNFPTHLAAAGQTNLLVTDSMNGRVQVLDLAGNFIAQIGKPGDSPGYFSRPKGIAADSLGNVYAVDAMFDNIQVFSLGGDFLLTVGAPGTQPGEFWLPNGIAISRQNEIFVADSYNRRVQVLRYVGPS